MSADETAIYRDGSSLMARPGAWIQRLPRWLTAPETAGSSGSSMGPRERLWMAIALAGILLWGFSGSWEYPALERSVAEPTVVARNAPTGGAELSAIAVGTPTRGAELFEANGCYACHSLEGERKIGPSLGGIFGTTVALNDGSTAVIDDAYLVESILYPQLKLVAGYEDAAMPSYEGLVSEDDARALAEYIRSLD